MLPAFGAAAATAAASAAANEAELGAATFDVDGIKGGEPGSGEHAIAWAPGGTDETFAKLFDNVRSLPSLPGSVADGGADEPAETSGLPMLDTPALFVEVTPLLPLPGSVVDGDAADDAAAGAAAAFNGLPMADTSRLPSDVTDDSDEPVAGALEEGAAGALLSETSGLPMLDTVAFVPPPNACAAGTAPELSGVVQAISSVGGCGAFLLPMGIAVDLVPVEVLIVRAVVEGFRAIEPPGGRTWAGLELYQSISSYFNLLHSS